MKSSLRDKFRGSLLLLALGDAMGAPYEGQPYNPGLRPKDVLSRKILRFTDDTIMALCIARAVVESGDYSPEAVSKKYVEWFLSGDLRGIGLTTYAALSALARGNANYRNSGIISYWAAGNGVAMRVAPIALLDANKDVDVLYEHVRQDAYITHRNELAISGAFAVALMIKGGLTISEKREVVEYAISYLAEFGIENKVKEAITRASKLAEKDSDALSAVLELGISGYVVESVASATYAFLKCDNPLDAIMLLIRAGGDTDSNAAIAGSIFGAFTGLENSGVPDEALSRLESKDEILRLADRLYELASKGKGGG